MVPPASHRVSRVPRYSGYSLKEIGFRLRGYHPLWLAFPYHSTNLSYRCVSPQPRRINPPVWPLPRSLATTYGISVDVFSSPYLDVSVQAVPLIQLCIHCMIPCGGFPHSEISGSKLICSSPKLIAAYHVLHRLLMPRHSPCALYSLTNRKQVRSCSLL